MIRFLPFLSVTFIINLSQAFSDGSVILEGTVKSFDKEFIELKTSDSIYKIPRNLIFLPKLKTNQAIGITLTKQQYEELNHIALPKK